MLRERKRKRERERERARRRKKFLSNTRTYVTRACDAGLTETFRLNFRTDQKARLLMQINDSHVRMIYKKARETGLI